MYISLDCYTLPRYMVISYIQIYWFSYNLPYPYIYIYSLNQYLWVENPLITTQPSLHFPPLLDRIHGISGESPEPLP